MTAIAQPADPSEPNTVPHLSPALEEAILEIAHSERALDDLLVRANRMHQSNIHHEPESCLVCFSGS